MAILSPDSYTTHWSLSQPVHLEGNLFYLISNTERTDFCSSLAQGSAEGDAKSLAEQLEVLQESIGGIRDEIEAEASCSTREECKAGVYAPQGRESGVNLRKVWEIVREVVLPILVVVLGVGFSVAALYVALASAIWPDGLSQPDGS